MKSLFHKGTGSIRHRKTLVPVSMLMVVVLLVLIVSTSWFMGSSQNATERSVHNVSKFYLEELSAQTGRQMQDNLDYQIHSLKAATQALKQNDLADTASLQSYISSMSDVYGFNFYAIADESGMVYTKNQAFLGQSEFSFLSDENFTSPQISVNQTLGTQNVILIAVPIQGLQFLGKALTGGVIGIYTDTISDKLSLKNDENQIFSNVILKDGSYIVKTPHYHLDEMDNVFTALQTQANFQEGSSVQQMQKNISEGKSGILSYYLQGSQHYTYYAPAEETGWYLTTTIHYGTVSANIETVRTTITKNSMIQLLLMLAVVTAVSFVYFWQRQRNEILHLEKIQAEENSRAKSLFLSNMSHDIRTPMNAIIGFTNLAIQYDSDPDRSRIHDYLLKIRSAGAHLLRLINDVLDMSRIESGKMQIETAPCSLFSILQDIQDILQGQIQEKQQTLQFDTSGLQNGDVYCDMLHFNQVMLNLLGNAVKFTPQGGCIKVYALQNDCGKEGYGSYEFHIKDNGIGMTPEFAKKVFEPFERERSSTVSGIQGTGLGMAITKNLIGLMGGTICVETELHKGTEFIIQIEFKIWEGGAGQETAQQQPDIEKPDFRGKRILLVEDNELNQEIACEILSQFGFITETAENGAAALAVLEHAKPGKFDLVLMDVQMPVMDGYTATRKIRALKGSPYADIAIIAMTANAFEEDKKDAIACGMDGHITKPIDVDMLLKVLSQILTA